MPANAESGQGGRDLLVAVT